MKPVVLEEGAGRERLRRFGTVAFVLVLVLGLALLFAWGLGRDPRLIRPVIVGRQAPDFSLPVLDGNRGLRLSDLRGQVVVINFWASWCTACRLEHPGFVAAWDRYRDRGVVFLGIIFEDSPDAARATMRELGGDWPQLLDPGSRVAQRYGVYGVPETFFIAPDGTVVHKQIGYTPYDLLVDQVEQLLKERSDERCPCASAGR
ncbi:MAG: TlpA family protein disulfide reductase [Actinomycetota bacterium]